MSIIRKSLFSIVFSAFVGVFGLVSTANADTATFVTPVTGDPATVSGGSDGIGVAVAAGQTLGLLVTNPFGLFDSDGFTPLNNNVSIFTLSDFGSALATLSFGRYNDGNSQIFYSQTINAQSSGTQINLNFLAFVGCGVSAGCDYIEITGLSTFNGARVILDAITFSDVALSKVSATTPEPGVWALMILGFMLIARQLKLLKRRNKLGSGETNMHTSQLSLASTAG